MSGRVRLGSLLTVGNWVVRDRKPMVLLLYIVLLTTAWWETMAWAWARARKNGLKGWLGHLDTQRSSTVFVLQFSLRLV